MDGLLLLLLLGLKIALVVAIVCYVIWRFIEEPWKNRLITIVALIGVVIFLIRALPGI